jgi:succinate dehydrogenase / fumarate reductase, cytochrome b subunit
MNWVIQTFSTSVGKKLLMAGSGMLFLVFLAVHLFGNFNLYGGPAAFNAYSDHLHALGPLLQAGEAILALAAIFHIATGLVLFVQNRKARPVRYAVDKSGGGRTWSSMFMPYTGLLILAFLVVHLATLSRYFAANADLAPFARVSQLFTHPGYVAFYVVFMLFVALHVRHGLWSAFQSVGANHPRYMPFIRGLSVAFAILVGFGFASLPLAVMFMS